MVSKLVSSFLGRKVAEQLVSIDIGSSTIKLMELDIGGEKPKLKSAGFAPTPAGAIQNNVITRPDAVGNAIRAIIEANGITSTHAVTCVPGPSVFTKKITMGHCSLKELSSTISYEASNYIPHSINAVHLDYQVLAEHGKSTMDVLLVAVKNEIIESFLEAITHSGLQPAIVDVDYFALENMFTMNYPEERQKTVAVINVGARYSSVNIIQDGVSIFTGDVAVGGRLYTDALCETLSLKPLEAEQAKMGHVPQNIDQHLLHETVERTTEHVASELQRQLGFFWNAASTDRAIESIYLSGGGAQVQGLLEELSAKTGLNCKLIDAMRGLDSSTQFDREYLDEISPVMSVSIGLAARRLGDKSHAIQ